MSKRTWLVLGLAFLVAGVLWWAARPAPRDFSVELIFLGNTNYGMERNFDIYARLLVTNKGVVPVKLWSTTTVRNAFIKPANPGAHDHLAPGQSAIIEVGPINFYTGAFARLGYRSDSFRDRLSGWAQRNRNAEVRKLANNLLRRPRLVVAETEWTTSLPSALPKWKLVPFDLLSTNWLIR